MSRALSASGQHLTGVLLHIVGSSPLQTTLKKLSALIRQRQHARPAIPSPALICTTSCNCPPSARAWGWKATTESCAVQR